MVKGVSIDFPWTDEHSKTIARLEPDDEALAQFIHPSYFPWRSRTP